MTVEELQQILTYVADTQTGGAKLPLHILDDDGREMQLYFKRVEDDAALFYALPVGG